MRTKKADYVIILLILVIPILVAAVGFGLWIDQRIRDVEAQVGDIQANPVLQSGRTTATVIQAVNGGGEYGACGYRPSTTEQERSGNTYLVRYLIGNIEKGICVHPDSRCAQEARVGAPLPESCAGK